MAVNAELSGTSYPPGPVYEVSREKIREFALATGATSPAHTDPEAARRLGYRDVVAPPTFAVIPAQRSEARYVEDPRAGIDFSRVVHGEEHFVHHRPIVAGDRLVAALHIDAIRVVGGNAMVTMRTELSALSADGAEPAEPVATAVCSLVVRAEED